MSLLHHWHTQYLYCDRYDTYSSEWMERVLLVGAVVGKIESVQRLTPIPPYNLTHLFTQSNGGVGLHLHCLTGWLHLETITFALNWHNIKRNVISLNISLFSFIYTYLGRSVTGEVVHFFISNL